MKLRIVVLFTIFGLMLAGCGGGGGGGKGAGSNNGGQTLYTAQAFMPDNALPWIEGVAPDDIRVTGINSSGAVCGYFNVPPVSGNGASTLISFIISGGTMQLVQAQGTPQLNAINDSGVAAGLITIGTGPIAVLEENGALTNLGAPPPYTISQANAINSNGQVAGVFENINGQTPFLHDGSGPLTAGDNLGLPTGFSGGYATAINNSGEVVGELLPANSLNPDGWFFDNGTMTSEPMPAGFGAFTAASINNNGEVVGDASPAGNPFGTEPFAWLNGQFTDLGLPSGADVASAKSVNDSGQVAGFAIGAAQGAYTYKSGQWISLNGSTVSGLQAGTTLLEADEINNQGVIAGVAALSPQVGQIFVLTPISQAAARRPSHT